ncbi:hypothetical protein EV401DRAFT_533830 [Pisolithus croceorrhizus]|nr:hypothetical protein EV401DRAFT_533830 [Pisolithus croceorrhizus]
MCHANITLVNLAGILTYHAPGQPPQLHLPQSSVASLEMALFLYSIPYPFQSSHMNMNTWFLWGKSFHCREPSGAQVFERTGLITEPMYHSRGIHGAASILLAASHSSARGTERIYMLCILHLPSRTDLPRARG